MEAKSIIKKIVNHKNTPLILVAAALIAFFQIMNENYLSIENIRGILSVASTTGMIAIGMSCLIISGQVDLSSAAIGCACGIFVTFISNAGAHWVLAFVCVILIGAGFGAINAFLITKLNLKAFIATLAMSSTLQGVARAMTDSSTIPVKDQDFFKFGSATLFEIPMPFVVTFVLFIIFGFILARTKFGRKIYMCGGNIQAARLAGINTKKMHSLLFIINGALCGLAGAMLTSHMRSGAPTAVIGKEFDAITVSVLGGVAFTGGSGTMSGCFIGMIMLISFNFGLSVIRVPSYWTIVAQGMLLIIALTLDFVRERARIRSLHASTSVKV